MAKQFKKNFSIIRPDLQHLIDKKKGKEFKISKEFYTFKNDVWWKRLFRWIFYKKR